MTKEIGDFDIGSIGECDLITLHSGTILYRRTLQSDPLTLNLSDSTFTTKAPLKAIGYKNIFRPSAASYATHEIQTMFKETEGYKDNLRVYRLRVAEAIPRILDLDSVCKKQRIKFPYFEKMENSSRAEKRGVEQKVHELYDLDLNGTKIYGVQYSSRKNAEGHCVVFFDNLPYLMPQKEARVRSREKSLLAILAFLENRKRRPLIVENWIKRRMLSLRVRMLHDYISFQDITECILAHGHLVPNDVRSFGSPSYYWNRSMTHDRDDFKMDSGLVE